ncbi:MAG: hypothetical protein LR015_06505 [Verrucomicrobia bacterium]|nr:hypothetical protein [Verrucomicrobiota bacterium]
MHSFTLLFAALVLVICFYDLAPMQSVVRPDQMSRIRVVAEFPFDYVSEIQTEQRREEQRRRVPPVYRINVDNMEVFAAELTRLVTELSDFARPPEGSDLVSLRVTSAEVQRFMQGQNLPRDFHPAVEDLVVLLNDLTPQSRLEALREGLIVLSELARQGILDASQNLLDAQQDQLTLFNVLDEIGRGRAGGMLTQEDALRNLRIHLAALDIPRSASFALFRLLRDGLEPNLEFDQERTEARIAAAIAQMPPVLVSVREGDTIIEPNVRVTALQFERYEAYRKARVESEVAQFSDRALFWERAILTIVLVLGVALYIETTKIRLNRKRRLVLMSAAIILLNLLLFRFVFNLGSSPLAETNPTLLYLIAYLMPVAFWPHDSFDPGRGRSRCALSWFSRGFRCHDAGQLPLRVDCQHDHGINGHLLFPQHSGAHPPGEGWFYQRRNFRFCLSTSGISRLIGCRCYFVANAKRFERRPAYRSDCCRFSSRSGKLVQIHHRHYPA